MTNYWENNALNIFAVRASDLEHNINLLTNLLRHFGDLKYFYIVMSISGLIISLAQKNKIAIITSITVVLLVVASYLRKNPVQDRLWMYIYVLAITYTVIFITKLRDVSRFFDNIYARFFSRTILTLVTVLFALMMIMTTRNFTEQISRQNVYLGGEEANALIAYVNDNIKDGEYLYCYYHSRYVLQFKIGYETINIGANVTDFPSEGNIIFGDIIWNGEEIVESDVEKVRSAGRCYVLFSHAPASRTNAFTNSLSQLGTFEKIFEFKGTPLYYFEAAQGGTKGADENPDPDRIIAFSNQDAGWMEDEYKGLKFVKGTALEMPFESERFDRVLSSAVIEHVG
jgi:hypothetical protein